MSNNADKAESQRDVTLPDKHTVDCDDKILRGEEYSFLIPFHKCCEHIMLMMSTEGCNKY